MSLVDNLIDMYSSSSQQIIKNLCISINILLLESSLNILQGNLLHTFQQNYQQIMNKDIQQHRNINFRLDSSNILKNRKDKSHLNCKFYKMNCNLCTFIKYHYHIIELDKLCKDHYLKDKIFHYHISSNVFGYYKLSNFKCNLHIFLDQEQRLFLLGTIYNLNQSN